MLIIGEKINSTLEGITAALDERDSGYIQALAKSQVKAGAHLLEVNAGSRGTSEIADMEWLVTTVQEAVDVPLCIDSPSPEVIEAGLKVHRGRAMINSVTAEDNRLDSILPLVKKYNCFVIALTHGKKGIPGTPGGRVEAARHIVDVATERCGIPLSDIYLDALVLPLSVDYRNAAVCLETLRLLKEHWPGVRTISGLSNVSYGLPNRGAINRLFVVLAMQVKLDAVIVNPLDQKLMTNLKLAGLLLAQDEDCRGYLRAHRNKALVF